MKKRILPVFVIVLALLTLFTAYATDPLPGCINDVAGVLTAEEETKLLALRDEYNATIRLDTYIVTVESLDGKSAKRYANDYYDTHCESGGLLLLIDTVGREYYILADGATNKDYYLDQIEEAILPYLQASDYAGACRAYLDVAHRNVPVDVSESSFDLSELIVPLIIVLAVSLLIAWGVTAAMKRKMKTARPKQTAHDYVRQDSFALREHSDLYLYRTRTRVRVNNNSSGGGRSGGSRGGRGGKF